MIDQVIAAAITRISGVTLGYTLNRVESYDGQVNEQNMADLLARTPSVFVSFAGARLIDQGNGTKWEASLSLLAVARNLSTPKAAREGKGIEVGANRIAEDLVMLLNRQTLGMEIDELEATDTRPLVPGWARDRKAAIVGVTFKTGWVVDPPPADADLADWLLSKFGLDYAPVDGVAESTVTVNMRGA